MNLPLDPTTAPDRLGNLIDQIIVACPDALILVAQIISSGSATTQQNIIQYNAAIPELVAARQANGSHVMIVTCSRSFSILAIIPTTSTQMTKDTQSWVMLGIALSRMRMQNWAGSTHLLRVRIVATWSVAAALPLGFHRDKSQTEPASEQTCTQTSYVYLCKQALCSPAFIQTVAILHTPWA
jgi:hypothetical protein